MVLKFAGHGYKPGFLLPTLMLLLSVISHPSAEASGSDRDCAAYDAAALAALERMSQSGTVARAGGEGHTKTPLLKLARSYRLKLSPQAAVKFPVEPGRPTLDDGSYAGLAAFIVARTGRYRVYISENGWIDVATTSGRTLESLAFNGKHQCVGLRKYVEFYLDSDVRYLLQFSGGGAAVLSVFIGSIE